MLFKEISNQFILYLQDNRINIIIKIIGTIVIFLIAQIINKWTIKKIKNKIKENTLQNNNDKFLDKTANLIGNIIHVCISITTILLIFAFLGLQVSLILGGISVALGFAMETTIKNMISGIFILMNSKLQIGNFVEILSPFNIRGTIEEVTLRHTIIKLIDKRKIIIPNGQLNDASIKTLKSEKIIKGEFNIHVARHTNINQVKKILINTINSNKNILYKNYTNNIISSFDENGFSIKNFFYYNPQLGKSAFVITSEIKKKLSTIFKKYGIKPAYTEEIRDTEKI